MEKLPNGVMDGRPDAKYGTYNTVVQESARGFQDQLLNLENKAFGLSKLADEDFIHQSEAVFHLEFEVIRLYREIADAPGSLVTEFERDSMLFNTVRAYKDVRHHSERLYENMIRFIDHAIPGPNGQQIRTEINNSTDHESLYYPNYRSDKDLTPAEKQQEYQKKLDGFLKKGGSLKEIKSFDAGLFRRLPEYSRFEYVWLESGAIMVTPGTAGHILLAQGAPVKSAGQIVIIKGKAPNSVMVIVSNASGNYKPDLLSAEQVAVVIGERFNIPGELVVVTKGEPLSTQEVKIYMKGQGVSPAEIDRKIQELENEGREILNPAPRGISGCGEVFSAA